MCCACPLAHAFWQHVPTKQLQKLEPNKYCPLAQPNCNQRVRDEKIHRRAAGGHLGPAHRARLPRDQRCCCPAAQHAGPAAQPRHDILTFILLSMITEGREPVGILYLFPYHQSAKKNKRAQQVSRGWVLPRIRFCCTFWDPESPEIEA